MPPREVSNIDQVCTWIDDVINSIDFTRPGEDESIGKDVAVSIAQEIADDAAEQMEPDGTPFPANEAKYAAWKGRKYGMQEPAYGYRTGQMLSLESLIGEVDVKADEVTMTYGKDLPPTRSSASGYISDQDKAVTDRQKMGWMKDKGVNIYKLSDLVRQRAFELIREWFARVIREKGGR